MRIEDPKEIWVDRATVQTVEARPHAIGTDLRPYTLADGVDDAVDLLVQIGISDKVKPVTAISNVAKDLKNGDVYFEPTYQYMEESTAGESRWEKLGELK